MANEEQPAEDKVSVPSIEREILITEVLGQTRAVNSNIGALLHGTGSIIFRLNGLLVLLIIMLTLNLLTLGLGFSMQQLQQSAKAQLTAVDLGRNELFNTVKEAKREVQAMREAVADLRTQLQSVPTVTTDNKGRINLEVPLDTASQKTVSEQPRVVGDTRAPDRLVIPLRPSQSRLSN